MACGPEKFRYQDDLMLDETGEATSYILLLRLILLLKNRDSCSHSQGCQNKKMAGWSGSPALRLWDWSEMENGCGKTEMLC